MFSLGTPILWYIIGKLYIQENYLRLEKFSTTFPAKMVTTDQFYNFDRVPFG